MTNEPLEVRDSDAKEFFEIRIAELRTSLATLEHVREHGEDAEFVRLNDAYIEASRAREAFDRRLAETRAMPEALFRWGSVNLPAMLWRCPCGCDNQSVNPAYNKAQQQRGAMMLARCPECGGSVRLIESAIVSAV